MKPTLRLMRPTSTNNSHEGEKGKNSAAEIALWNRARRENAADYSAVCANSLEALSDTIRLEIEARESSSQIEAARSFGTVHARLMESINVSTPLTAVFLASEPPAFKASEAYHRSHETVARPPRRAAWGHLALSWGLAGVALCAVGVGGHHLGRQSAAMLPTATLISDFDVSLHSGKPLPLLGADSRVAARWLGRKTGIAVHLPAIEKAGVRLIGARSHSLGGQLTAQAHYERRGVRLALYQMNAPEIGLGELDRQNVRGRAFFTRSSNHYQLVAWRSGENVLAMVSPLEMSDAVQVAAAMRDNPDAFST